MGTITLDITNMSVDQLQQLYTVLAGYSITTQQARQVHGYIQVKTNQ